MARILTVCGKQEMGLVPSFQPGDSVDLLVDIETFEVVELRFMTLECAVHIVLPVTR